MAYETTIASIRLLGTREPPLAKRRGPAELNADVTAMAKSHSGSDRVSGATGVTQNYHNSCKPGTTACHPKPS